MPDISFHVVILYILVTNNNVLCSQKITFLRGNCSNYILAWVDRLCIPKVFRKELNDLLVRQDPKLIDKVLTEFPVDPNYFKKTAIKKTKQKKTVANQLVEADAESVTSDSEEEDNLTKADFDYAKPTTVNHVKLGAHVNYKDCVYLVTYTQHISQGRGKGHFKLKLKNIKTDKEGNFSFSDTSKLDVIIPSKLSCKFVNVDPQSGNYNFVRVDNGKLVVMPKNHHSPYRKYLKEDLHCTLLRFKDTILSLTIPFSIDYRVIKLDTCNFAATLENNLVITVPTYIKVGDIVQISTTKGEFMKRIINK
ncbi:Elongation factor P [Babesia microti strain RI]|uniref:Elongation factor P n=1 Tax=Babesia microti (strain RI) TaxID=1133968 RepID=I7IHE3_BABMR|nr:Elongation factor P [Babesia microti strain RI]CCF75662.1 Elongation factor P [Babesia microti strain RI]|eukprot:XP_012650070.1 Elongation factor P [Babesia microti strain RI]